MSTRKHIGLVAHDTRKPDLIEWVEFNAVLLVRHHLVCTGTSGRLVREALEARLTTTHVSTSALDVRVLKSGPLGGDQQLGALIADDGIDLLIFFWDPMENHPHDVDVKALLRIAVLYNIPIACNRASADYLISSPLVDRAYQRQQQDYSAYSDRDLRAPRDRSAQ